MPAGSASAPLVALLVIAFAVPVVSLLRLSFGRSRLHARAFRAHIATVPLYRSVLPHHLDHLGLTTLCVVMSYPSPISWRPSARRIALMSVVIVLPLCAALLILHGPGGGGLGAPAGDGVLPASSCR